MAEDKHKAIQVKVTYQLFDPEITNMTRFFNGTVIKYYAIQNEDMTSGEPDNDLLKKYREQVLDELLGYDLELVDRTVRRRKSTTDFRTVQQWNTFINRCQETLFDGAGYEFPDSDEFWKLAGQVGYEKAEGICLQRLQKLISSRLHEQN